MKIVSAPGQRMATTCPAQLRLPTTRRGRTAPQCCTATSTSGRDTAGIVSVAPDGAARHNVVSTSESRQPFFLSFAGGGIYFFWQLGAVKYLIEHYDLTSVPMAGASSGAIVASLAACGVDPDLAVETAYELSVEYDIWNRKLGLLGIWGGLIRNWLDRLLPDNAHELVAGRLHVVIAKAPTLDLFEVTSFDSKEDLIEAIMASAHVPFFLDGKPFLPFRGRLCWDGSIPDFVYFSNSEYLTRGPGGALVIDYSHDELLEWTRGDFLKLRSHEEIMGLIDKGYQYVQRMHESGLVQREFDLCPYKRAS